MRLLALVLFLTGISFAQIDNRYCTDENTWKGTSDANPQILDGPAALPMVCINTDSKNTPSPGPVVIVDITQSLQAAYNAATCGTTIQLTHGGVWNDPFSFAPKGCDDQHWITITTDGHLPPEGFRIAPSYIPEMAQLKIARTSGLLSVGDHLRFVGIYWQKNTRNGGILYIFAQTKGSNKVIFDRNIFRGNPREDTQHGVQINTGKYIAVIDSWMDEFHCSSSCTDSQTISGGTGSGSDDVTQSGPVKIVNNFLEASTETILFGGAQANGVGPNDVEIRRNLLYKPLSWMPSSPTYIGNPAYVVKNCFELKNGSRVLFEGNVCQNNWGGFSQRGYAFLLTPKNQAGSGGTNLCPLCAVVDVTMRYNYIHTSCLAFQIGSGISGNGGWSLGQHRTSIHDNVADDLMFDGAYSCGFNLNELGSGYDSANPPPDAGVMTDVTLNHNTFLNSGLTPSSTRGQEYALIQINGPPPNVRTPQASNVSFTDNVATTLAAGLYTAGGGTNNCASITKPSTPVNIWTTCFVGTSPFTGNVLIGYPGPVGNWPSGNLFSPSIDTVGFYDYANAVYSVPQTSPYLAKGANMDLVTLAIFGTREESLEAPTKKNLLPPPSLPPPITGPLPAFTWMSLLAAAFAGFIPPAAILCWILYRVFRKSNR